MSAVSAAWVLSSAQPIVGDLFKQKLFYDTPIFLVDPIHRKIVRLKNLQ
jgi:hypothetical protein